MKTTTAIMILAAGMSLSASVFADSFYKPNKNHKNYDDGGFYDYAKVIRSEPLYRTVQVPSSYEDCRTEPVTHQARYRDNYRDNGYTSYTPHLLGGLIGGVVGNQFGKGGGKDALTVAGAVLGASIGRDQSNKSRHQYASQSYTTHERRCVTRTSYRDEQQIDGYQVTYKYKGHTYSTHMTNDPGHRMRVRVDVTPVASTY